MTDIIISGKYLRDINILPDASGLEVYGVKGGKDYRALAGFPGGLSTLDPSTGNVPDAQIKADIVNAPGRVDTLESRADALEAGQAAGMIGFSTKATMDATLTHNAGTLALVTNDGTAGNNTTYIKLGASGAGSWQVSTDRVTVVTSRVDVLEPDNTVNKKRVNTLETREASRGMKDLSSNSSLPEIVYGITDNKDKLALGITKRGTLLLPSGEDKALSIDNTHRAVWGIVDNQDQIAIAIAQDGTLITASGEEVLLSEDNNQDFVYAITDLNGNVALGIKKSGEVVAALTQAAGTLIEQAGDIYLIAGGNSTQLTSSGDNSSPRFVGPNVRFVSSRRRTVLAEYDADQAGTTEVRAYADSGVYEQILITGQSLAQGGANAAITTTAPFPDNAFKFANGPVGSATEQIVSSVAPLSEDINETIATGFAKKLLTVALDRTLLLSGQATGGASYADIKKNGNLTTFGECIEQVGFGAALNGGAGVRALFLIHGEADSQSATYAADLVTLLNDYTADIKITNGQTEPVVMLLCQTSSASGYTTEPNRDLFISPFQQLQASESHPRIFLVGPKYHLTYVDHAHIDALSTRLHGEYYAKVYRRVVIEGLDWKPVSPSLFTVVGSTVVIDFNVPVEPLVFDTTLVTDPGNKGFVLKNSGAVTITSVAITGNKQVTVTLSAAPPVASVLSYAIHNGTDSVSGPTGGSRGCLRDSDTDPSAYTAAALYNWCVAFKHTF